MLRKYRVIASYTQRMAPWGCTLSSSMGRNISRGPIIRQILHLYRGGYSLTIVATRTRGTHVRCGTKRRGSWTWIRGCPAVTNRTCINNMKSAARNSEFQSLVMFWDLPFSCNSSHKHLVYIFLTICMRLPAAIAPRTAYVVLFREYYRRLRGQSFPI